MVIEPSAAIATIAATVPFTKVRCQRATVNSETRIPIPFPSANHQLCDLGQITPLWP